MGKKIRKRLNTLLYRWLLPYGGLFLVKLISATYRVHIINPENENRVLADYGSLVYASWHQRFFPGITFFSRRKPIAILISQSRDGDFISRVVAVLGWRPVRGSSTRGGSQGLQQLKQLARQGYKIGHIVDGPNGPFGVIKPGLIRIAQEAGVPIVPTITSARKVWTFKSWDRFMVPKPFTRVIIRFGDAIEVPPVLTTEAFESMRRLVEDRMAVLYEETDRMWHPLQNA